MKYEIIIIMMLLAAYILLVVIMLEIVYFEQSMNELIEGVNLLIGGNFNGTGA